MGASWNRLPPELKLDIFEYLVDNYVIHTAIHDYQPGHCFRKYAGVDREWRAFFERHLYKRIVLNQDGLSILNSLSPRHRSMVRHIWFRVALPRCCVEGEDPESAKRNDLDTVDAIRRLFRALSAWNPPTNITDNFVPSLTLQVSVHSVGHARHGQNALCHQVKLHSNPKGWYLVASIQRCQDRRARRRQMRKAVDSLAYAWQRSQQTPFAVVRNVTSLLINKRDREVPSVAPQLLQSLPDLTQIHYEGSTTCWYGSQLIRDRYEVGCFPPATVANMAALTLSRDPRERSEHPIIPFYSISRFALPPNMPHPVLSFVSLERLTISFRTDALEFFRNITTSAAGIEVLPKLKQLSLTSRHLAFMVTSNGPGADEVIQLAAEAASRLSALCKMQIWFAEQNSACAFIYERHGLRAELAIRGTWALELSSSTMETWQVAVKQPGLEALSQGPGELLEEGKITSLVDGIRLLRLPIDVVDALTSRQTGVEVF